MEDQGSAVDSYKLLYCLLDGAVAASEATTGRGGAATRWTTAPATYARTCARPRAASGDRPPTPTCSSTRSPTRPSPSSTRCSSTRPLSPNSLLLLTAATYIQSISYLRASQSTLGHWSCQSSQI